MAWFEHGDSRIYYEEGGSGDALLFLPGFTDSIQHYGPLREALAAKYRVIAADLPGSGNSGPQPRHYTPTYYEEDARSFIALLQHLAAEPAHLTGFSDGGETALLMAALEPGAARSVFVWGAGGQISDPGGTLSDAFHTIVDNPAPGFEGFHDYLIASYGEENARLMMQSFAQAMRAIDAAGGDISLGRAHRITCPTMLVVGENDPMVSMALISQLAAAVPNAQTWVVDGLDHDVYHPQAELFTQTLLDWLERHST
jgi:valacyclovir hydrolase